MICFEFCLIVHKDRFMEELCIITMTKAMWLSILLFCQYSFSWDNASYVSLLSNINVDQE
jgi:hypothetical protein